jgi:hypothetical protein
MRNTVKRRLFGIVGSLAMAAGVLVATGGAAQAASPCPGKLLNNLQITGGYISVYYNAATGRNCALTYTNHPGVAQEIWVKIGLWDSSTEYSDHGNYKYYAGPVSVAAAGKCIWVGGSVGANSDFQAVGPTYCD